MSKKDFEVVAKIVGMLTRGTLGRTSKRANWVNSRLEETNPNFNKERFWDAVEDYANKYYK